MHFEVGTLRRYLCTSLLVAKTEISCLAPLLLRVDPAALASGALRSCWWALGKSCPASGATGQWHAAQRCCWGSHGPGWHQCGSLRVSLALKGGCLEFQVRWGPRRDGCRLLDPVMFDCDILGNHARWRWCSPQPWLVSSTINIIDHH